MKKIFTILIYCGVFTFLLATCLRIIHMGQVGTPLIDLSFGLWIIGIIVGMFAPVTPFVGKYFPVPMPKLPSLLFRKLIYVLVLVVLSGKWLRIHHNEVGDAIAFVGFFCIAVCMLAMIIYSKYLEKGSKQNQTDTLIHPPT